MQVAKNVKLLVNQHAKHLAQLLTKSVRTQREDSFRDG